MVAAIKWAREQSVPFLGICLGFQMAVVEWARNVCDLQGERNIQHLSNCVSVRL
jgi:CTP synthase